MQQTSALYQSIITSDNHWFETQLVIEGAGTFGETDLFSISTSHQMFHGSPTIGSAVAGEIQIKMVYPQGVSIPTMARLMPQVRVCNATQQSEWLAQGVYFVDTRERTVTDTGESVLELHGYDAMLKAEQPFQSNTITGDSTDTDMVDEIASILGVEVDSRTYNIMTNGYTVPLPTGYSCREVLGFIGSMYVGSFVMSEEGKLRLVSITELPPETSYLIDEVSNAITFGHNSPSEEVSLTGETISFDNGNGEDFTDFSFDFSETQDLNGYNAPWVGGAGKNKLPNVATSGTSYGITRTLNDDGSLTLEGTATSTFNIQVAYISTNDWFDKLPDGDYILTGCPAGGSSSKYRLVGNINGNARYATDTGSGVSFTKSAADTQMSVYIRMNSGTVIDNLVFYPMIRASDADATYEPYENICPIQGIQSADVKIAQTQTSETGTVIPVSWETEVGTAYGGTVDVISGKLTITRVKEVLTGSENFGLYSNTRRFAQTFANLGWPVPNTNSSASNLSNAVCSVGVYQTGATGTASFGNYRLSATSIMFYDPQSVVATAEDFASLCAAHYADGTPFEVCYDIATPIEYQITPHEVQTLLGSNYVETTANGTISITYNTYESEVVRILV